MATAFAESTLGQLYKERDSNGNFRGGPAYYMSKGLKNRKLAESPFHYAYFLVMVLFLVRYKLTLLPVPLMVPTGSIRFIPVSLLP